MGLTQLEVTCFIVTGDGLIAGKHSRTLYKQRLDQAKNLIGILAPMATHKAWLPYVEGNCKPDCSSTLIMTLRPWSITTKKNIFHNVENLYNYIISPKKLLSHFCGKITKLLKNLSLFLLILFFYLASSSNMYNALFSKAVYKVN